jgi:hypothetical protein
LSKKSDCFWLLFFIPSAAFFLFSSKSGLLDLATFPAVGLGLLYLTSSLMNIN